MMGDRLGRVLRLSLHRRAKQMSRADEPSSAKTPYWLLWSTGIIAAVIGIAAFVLWSVNGVTILFEMIVALCM